MPPILETPTLSLHSLWIDFIRMATMLSVLALLLCSFTLSVLYNGMSLISANEVPSRSCCAVLGTNDHVRLLKCLNTSSADQYTKALSREATQPSLTVIFVSRVTSEVSSYGAYSRMVVNTYAEHNGYTVLPLWKDSDRADYPYHRKLVPLIDALRSSEVYSDYVAWVDADLIPLDINFRVEQVAARYPRAHVLLSKDASSVANTGFIIVKGNSAWAERLLEDWLAQMHTPGVDTEQLGFEAVYRSRAVEEMEAKVVILPAHVLNSVATPMGQQLPHHQILHLAAESASMRAAVFQQAAANLCTAFSSGKKPPHQLGITRKYLQQTAKQVYGEAFQRLEEQIVLHAETISTADFAEYRTSASKYCYAENYSQNFTETPQILQLRTRAHIIGANFTLTRVRDLSIHAANYSVGLAPTGVEAERCRAVRDALSRPEVVDRSLHEDLVSYTTSISGEIATALDATVQTMQSYAATIGPRLSRLSSRDCVPSQSRTRDSLCDELLFHQFWLELPEMIKLCAELSHDLLVALLSAPGPTLPRPNIFSPIAELVDEVPPHRDPRLIKNLLHTIGTCIRLLNKIVHPSQLGLVEIMAKDMDSLTPKIKELMM